MNFLSSSVLSKTGMSKPPILATFNATLPSCFFFLKEAAVASPLDEGGGFPALLGVLVRPGRGFVCSVSC